MHFHSKSIGSMISKRKQLHNNRKVLSNFSLMFAVIGIVLMVVDIEVTTYNITSPLSGFSIIGFSLKILVSIFTVLLLFTLILYHRVDILLYMNQNNLNNWRFVLTIRWSLTITLELLICSIHAPPIPHYNYVWQTYRLLLGRPEREDVPVNVLITIIMFLRGYLVFRVIVLHSHIYGHSSSRFVELMQGRTINSQFALKYLLTVHSKAFLIVSVISLVLWTSWGVRVCEIYEKDSNLGFFNNVWFIAITFMTIGYGDIVPRSVCGRFVAVLAGVFGVMYTAYVVAFIAETLQLSYSESYLHQFVIDSDLEKGIKHQAILIIQNFWRLKRATNSSGHPNSDILKYQLRLYKSKQALKMLKNEKIQLKTMSLRISTLYYSQNQIQHEIGTMKDRIRKINELTLLIVDCFEKQSNQNLSS